MNTKDLNATRAPRTVQCTSCLGAEEPDDIFTVKVPHTKRKLSLCYTCYANSIDKCMICENEEILSHQISNFEVVKLEDAIRSTIPPGIFAIRYDQRAKQPGIENTEIFVAELPFKNAEFPRSGIICKKCSKPYSTLYKALYKPYTKQKEIAHTKSTILNTNMLRDLEYDIFEPDAYKNAYWNALKKIYTLPDTVQTYHEHIFVEHKGVKVYSTGEEQTWFTVNPEPRYRGKGVLGAKKGVFAVWELANYDKFFQIEKDRAEQVTQGPKHWSPNPEVQAALIAPKPTIINAIDIGILTQDGILGQSCELLFF